MIGHIDPELLRKILREETKAKKEQLFSNPQMGT